MAYSDFTLARAKDELGITVTEGLPLFADISPVPASSYLHESIKRSQRFVTLVNTEKARSEYLVAPILGEVLEHCAPQASLFPGVEFNVDKERGLQGFCDFILSQSPEQIDLEAPVVTITEAKNESIRSGMGQCIAEMVAAQLFNQRRGKPVDYIYGAITTGTNWRFMRLHNSLVEVEGREYFVNEIEQILGILTLPLRQN